jgi:hypothetical protein
MASQRLSLAAVVLITPLQALSFSSAINPSTANLPNQAIDPKWPLATSYVQTGWQIPQTPSSWTREFRQVTPHQVTQDHGAEEVARQLELNDRQIALMQLEQTGRPAVTERRPSLFLEPQLPVTVEGRIVSSSKKSVALQQTKVEERRQKNPALALLILEGALQWYALCAWAICLLVTGLSSACCVYHGKLPLQRPRDQAQRPFFSYPAGFLSRLSRRQASQEVPAASEVAQPDQEPSPAGTASQAESDRVETWTKVPLHQASRMSGDWPGYLDDSDEENSG